MEQLTGEPLERHSEWIARDGQERAELVTWLVPWQVILDYTARFPEFRTFEQRGLRWLPDFVNRTPVQHRDIQMFLRVKLLAAIADRMFIATIKFAGMEQCRLIPCPYVHYEGPLLLTTLRLEPLVWGFPLNPVHFDHPDNSPIDTIQEVSVVLDYRGIQLTWETRAGEYEHLFGRDMGGPGIHYLTIWLYYKGPVEVAGYFAARITARLSFSKKAVQNRWEFLNFNLELEDLVPPIQNDNGSRRC